MTKTERQKAHHLNLCRIGFRSFDKRFIRNMAWLAEHDKDKPLTKKQRLCLDQLVYRYRAQLASRMPADLMIETQPDPAHYGLNDPDPKTGDVPDLFTGKPSKPHETKNHEIDQSPQSSLL